MQEFKSLLGLWPILRVLRGCKKPYLMSLDFETKFLSRRFSQKRTNEFVFLSWLLQDRKTNSFVCFLGKSAALQFWFEIYWPLSLTIWCLIFISGWKDSQQKKKDEAKQKLAAKKVETVDEEDDDDVIEVDPNEADNAR